MRNRALHDALRNFALEAAALLTDDLRAGAEVEFDVVNEGGPRGPALYHYQPRIHAFIGERWERLRELPGCEAACHELGAGASTWLRMNGLRGEQAEPALRAFFAKHMSYAVLRADQARVYRETYTDAEVQELARFYGSDIGRRFLAKMPLMMARSQELASQRMQSQLPELMSILQAQMGGRP